MKKMAFVLGLFFHIVFISSISAATPPHTNDSSGPGGIIRFIPLVVIGLVVFFVVRVVRKKRGQNSNKGIFTNSRSKFLTICSIIMVILFVIFLFIGFSKLSDKTEYVGGDAYNYIINAGKATAYLILAFGFLISSILIEILNIYRCNSLNMKEHNKQNTVRKNEESIIDDGAIDEINEKYTIREKITVYVEPKVNSNIICSLLIGETIEIKYKKEINGNVWCKVKDKDNNIGWCLLYN
jgi:preprotein translocase subunit YajC